MCILAHILTEAMSAMTSLYVALCESGPPVFLITLVAMRKGGYNMFVYDKQMRGANFLSPDPRTRNCLQRRFLSIFDRKVTYTTEKYRTFTYFSKEDILLVSF